MRSLLIFVVMVGLGALFWWQKHNEASAPATAQPVATTQVTPAPAATVSEHDWMKRSIDRATAVRDQARARTKEAQDP